MGSGRGDWIAALRLPSGAALRVSLSRCAAEQTSDIQRPKLAIRISCHLNHEYQALLEKAGDIIDIGMMADPDYHIAIDKVDV